MMRSYALLVITWLFVAASIVYFFVILGSEPPIALWIILGLVSVIPLADRLKIGNWFDFTKKVGNLSKEISSTQKEVHQVSSRLNAFIANVQSQQQINIGLNTKEAAQVIAEYISSAHKVSYPPNLEEISSAGEDTFFSEKMSPTDRQRFFFVEAADEAIAGATAPMRILYYAKLARQQHKRPKGKQIVSKKMISIIEELQHDWNNIFAIDNENAQQYLEYIKTLFTLRDEVYEKNIEPPSVKGGKKLLQDAYYAIAYFSGFISAGFAVWFAPSLLSQGSQE